LPRYKNTIKRTRLDAFLAEVEPLLSRKLARDLCKEGLVKIEGRIAAAGEIVELEQEVEVRGIPNSLTARPELVLAQGGALKFLSVVFENDNLLVVNKPRCMHSVVQRWEDPVTVADCVAAYNPDCLKASEDFCESGLVQRLDFYTSGLMIAAKHRRAWRKLRELIESEKVEKDYLALVEGRLKKEEFVIKFPLVSAGSGKRVKAVKEGKSVKNSLNATTKINLQHYIKELDASLVIAKANRGRRHQVRVHLSATGHPLLGDELYGCKRKLKDVFPSQIGFEEGFLLHAQSLKFKDPISSEDTELNLSSEWQELIK